MTRGIARAPTIALALMALAGATGCGSGDDSGDKAGGKEGQRGGTLTMLAVDDVDTLDPGIAYYQFSFAILNDVNRRLYAYKPDDPTTPVPDLASAEPEISADGRTVTVKLRAGVRFAPPVNREVTSDDVRYAFERAFTKAVPNGYVAGYFGNLVGLEAFKSGKAKAIAGIETPDDHTIVFRSTTGGPLAAALVLPVTSPVPREYARRFDAKAPSQYAAHQIATGPYMLQADDKGKVTGYKPNKSITLVRNPNWDATSDFRPAYLDRVVVQEGNSNFAVAERRILRGKGLASGDFGASPATLAREYERRKAQFSNSADALVRYIAMDTSTAPFEDLNVRRAVMAGIDREEVRQARGGPLVGTIATHFIGPSTPGHEEAGGAAGPDFDFARNPRGDLAVAAKYFKAAGFASGRYEGRDEILQIGVRGGVAQAMDEAVKAQLERLGFKVKLRLVSQNAFLTRFVYVPKSGMQITSDTSWGRDFADPQSILDTTFNGASITPTYTANASRLDSPEINAAMTTAAKLSDPQERAKAWGAIDRMIIEQAAAVPFLWDTSRYLFSADVAYVADRGNGGAISLAFTSLRR